MDIKRYIIESICTVFGIATFVGLLCFNLFTLNALAIAMFRVIWVVWMISALANIIYSWKTRKSA